jgi:hypothetical protein
MQLSEQGLDGHGVLQNPWRGPYEQSELPWRCKGPARIGEFFAQAMLAERAKDMEGNGISPLVC